MSKQISQIAVAACSCMLFLLGLPAAAQPLTDLKAIQEAADQALNSHDLDRWLSFFTDDGVFEWTPAPAPFTGKAEIRAFFEGVFAGFPDFATTDGRVFVAGPVVVVEHSTTGHQRGEWQGIPPTGNSAPMPHIDVYDFEGNKIKRATTYADAGGVMMQLGVMPVPATPKLIPSFTPPAPELTGLTPIRAAVEAVARWNTHDLVHYAKMVSSDATFFIAPFGASMDRSGWLAASELYFQGFSNVRLDVTRELDLGDGWVLVEGVARGTHDGPFFGVPPSGVAASVKAGLLIHINTAGQLDVMNDYYDNLSLMAQIMPKCPERPPVPDYLVQDEITSPSLQGNLLGDPATRPLLVYLPPSYQTAPDRRYPTIYLLHGFCADHTCFISTGTINVGVQAVAGFSPGVDVKDVMAELMAAGLVQETIIVMPNAMNSLGGSMYERSPLIGDYRSYIAKDVVGYIDGRYRTLANRDHRAIAGHSMGGHGALSLALEYPEVFGAVAALSPAWSDVEAPPTPTEEFTALFPLVPGLPLVGSTDDNLWNLFLGGMERNVLYALAAAWTPNVLNPPFYVDLPIRYPGPTLVPDIWEIWKQRDLVSQLERNGANLSNTPIFVDEGRGATMLMAEVAGVGHLLAALHTQGLSYTYDAFDGDHLTHLRYQLASALKFLDAHIAPTAPKK